MFTASIIVGILAGLCLGILTQTDKVDDLRSTGVIACLLAIGLAVAVYAAH